MLIQPSGGKGMRFRPTVLMNEPNRELRWKGKFLFPGLFDGEHFFRIGITPDGAVLFQQGEVFSGLLVALVKRSLDGATSPGLHHVEPSAETQGGIE